MINASFFIFCLFLKQFSQLYAPLKSNIRSPNIVPLNCSLEKYLKFNRSQITYVIRRYWLESSCVPSCRIASDKTNLLTIFACLHNKFLIRTERLLQLLLNKVYFFSVLTFIVGKSTKTQFKREIDWLGWENLDTLFRKNQEKKNCAFLFY